MNHLGAWRFAVAASVMCSAFASSAAQAPTAHITGRVADLLKVGLPGVTITVVASELRRQIVTDATGRFDIGGLAGGTYTVTATLTGFRTERRTIEVAATGSVTLNLTMRIACATTYEHSDDRGFVVNPPFVDARLLARSDVVADIVIVERSDTEAASGSDCRRRYRARVLQTFTRPRYGRLALRTIDVVVPSYISEMVVPGGEYVVWLSWRADENAFDAGEFIDGFLRPVTNGNVRVRRETYDLDELFKIFEDEWRRAVR